MTASTSQPFDPLFVDEYADDAPADWGTLASAGAPWSGAILKATQGLTYSSGEWLRHNWQALAAASAASGNPLLRGAYHYAELARSGKAQAEFFLRTMASAGGFASGDLWPIVDVESADNAGVTAQQTIDCVSAFAETIQAEIGRATMMYGGSLPYDLGITSRMGCSWLWLPRYTATLPASTYERIGWSLDALWGWQYKGAGGQALLETPSGVVYPSSAPGCGNVDLTVLTFPGGMSALVAALSV